MSNNFQNYRFFNVKDVENFGKSLNINTVSKSKLSTKTKNQHVEHVENENIMNHFSTLSTFMESENMEKDKNITNLESNSSVVFFTCSTSST